MKKMKKEEVLVLIEEDMKSFDTKKWSLHGSIKVILVALKYLVEAQWPR